MVIEEQKPLSAAQRKNFSKLGRKAWDECFGDQIESKKNAWRVAYVSWAITGLSLWGCIHLGSLPKQVVIPIEVDKLGHVVNATNLQDQPLSEKEWDAIYTADMEAFVRDWRTVTSDKSAQDAMWDRALQRCGGGSQAYAYVSQWYADHNPEQTYVDGKLVQVRIDTTSREGNTTYRVWWTETTLSTSGEVKTTQRWQAQFTFVKKEGLNYLMTEVTPPEPVHA